LQNSACVNPEGAKPKAELRGKRKSPGATSVNDWGNERNQRICSLQYDGYNTL